MHHERFVERRFVDFTLHMDHGSLRERSQQLMRRLSFVDHLALCTAAAHAGKTLINRAEVGVRHPCGVKVNRLHIQRILDEAGVVEQTVIGRVGHHSVNRPRGVRRFLHTLFNGLVLKFALRDTAQNAVGVAGRAQIDWDHIAHHHQMRERLVAVTVNQHSAAGRSGVQTDDLIGGRRAVRNDVAAVSIKRLSDVFLSIAMRTGVVKQRAEFTHGNRNVSLEGVGAEEVIEQCANRAVLEGRAAHMARRAECVLAFFGEVDQCACQRRRNSLFVFFDLLRDRNGDVRSVRNFIFEEFNIQ